MTTYIISSIYIVYGTVTYYAPHNHQYHHTFIKISFTISYYTHITSIFPLCNKMQQYNEYIELKTSTTKCLHYFFLSVGTITLFLTHIHFNYDFKEYLTRQDDLPREVILHNKYYIINIQYCTEHWSIILVESW